MPRPSELPYREVLVAFVVPESDVNIEDAVVAGEDLSMRDAPVVPVVEGEVFGNECDGGSCPR